MNKLKLAALSINLCVAVFYAQAQRNFYHRIDVGTSNVPVFALSNIVTGYLNYLTHDILFEDSYVYTVYRGNFTGAPVDTKAYNPIGLSARDLFNDSFCGVKLGYMSDNAGWFNWGLYASAHYRINQFKTILGENSLPARYQYVKPGAGFLLTFGDIGSPVIVQLEAAMRYDIPVGFKGLRSHTTTDILNKGFSSHYSVKFAGYSGFSVGAFADFNHYNLFNTFPKSTFKPYSFGVTFTITPKRGEDIYDY